MTSETPLPRTSTDVTPAWLTAVLSASAWGRWPAVQDFRWEIIGQDFGFTGVVARVWLDYMERPPHPSAPSSLIAKFPLAERERPSAYRNHQTREPAVARDYFDRCAREVWFYQVVAGDRALPAPEAYFAAVDEVNQTILLLLQDFPRARGGDAVLGCTVEEAASVLAAIVPLHARWWDNVDQSALQTIPTWPATPLERQQRYAYQVEPFLERYGAGLPTYVHQIVRRLARHVAAVMEQLERVPATLIHADLHLDNVLFTQRVGEPPVILLDWQSVSRRPAVIDLGFFLFGSLSPADRQSHEGALLREYHHRLVDLGVDDYSLSALQRDLSFALLWQLTGVVGWLANADFAGMLDRERKLADAAISDGRLVSALIDYDVLSLLPE